MISAVCSSCSSCRAPLLRHPIDRERRAPSIPYLWECTNPNDAMSSGSEGDELASLDRVLTRLALTEEEKLEQVRRGCAAAETLIRTRPHNPVWSSRGSRVARFTDVRAAERKSTIRHRTVRSVHRPHAADARRSKGSFISRGAAVGGRASVGTRGASVN